MSRSQPKSSQRGFSLIELMIALVLGLVIIGGAITVFLSNKQSYRSNNALSQVQEGSRISFELMARDIRQAGLTGCGNLGRVASVLNNGPSNDSNGDGNLTNDDDWWGNFANSVRGYDNNDADPAVDFGSDTAERVAGTDSIQLIGIIGSGLSIRTHNAATMQIALNEPAANLAMGDIVIICDPISASIAQITAYNAGTATLTLSNAGTATPGNCSQGLGFPATCISAAGNQYTFGANSQIGQMSAADWYVGNNVQGGTSLYQMAVRNNAGAVTAVAQEMIRNVSNLQIQYLVGNNYVSANAVTAAQWPGVSAIRVTLTVQGNEQFTGTDGQPLSRQLTASIALRNRVP